VGNTLRNIKVIFLIVASLISATFLLKVARANEVVCERVATGALKVFQDAELTSDSRFILKYNKMAMLKGNSLNVAITRIADHKTVIFKTKEQSVFVGASLDLSKILLQSSVGDRSEFFLYNINGDNLFKFKIPSMDQLDEDINEVYHDSINHQWLIATNRRVLAFLESQKVVKTLFELNAPGEVNFEWFSNLNKSESFLFVDQGRSIVILTAQIKDGKTISQLRLFDSKSFHLKKYLEITSQSSPLLFDDSHLLFDKDDKKTLFLVDLVKGELKKLDLEINRPRSLFISDPIKGFDKSFGLIDDKGIIRYYSSVGKVLHQIQIPNYMKWSIVKLIEGSQKLVLLDKDQISIFIFDGQSGELTKMPQVMNTMAYSGSVSLIENEIFFPIFNKQINRFSLLEYRVQSLCVNNLPLIKDANEFIQLLNNNEMTVLSLFEGRETFSKWVFDLNFWISLPEKEKELLKKSIFQNDIFT
jgi:hypothetical protein